MAPIQKWNFLTLARIVYVRIDSYRKLDFAGKEGTGQYVRTGINVAHQRACPSYAAVAEQVNCAALRCAAVGQKAKKAMTTTLIN